jgi:hypothetical protein
VKWFKHDSDAAQDAKLRKVIIKYGPTGYAVYFYCLELIAGNVSDSNITFELEHDAEIVADGLKVQGTQDKAAVDLVNDIMRYMVALGLFEASGDRITCLKMAKRLDQSMTSNSRMRGLIARAKENHDPIMISHDSVMINHEKSCKTRLEETRREEKKRETRAVARHPSLDVPMSQARYDGLAAQYGRPLVDDYMERVRDWASAKGRRLSDYAAAAANWIKNDVQAGKLKIERRYNDAVKDYSHLEGA